MASRAVVFRPVNADDVSCTPFEANTTFKISESDYLASNYIMRHGIHNNQTTPISASNLSADNIKNADGTFQTPTWKAIDHMFYRPENKHQPMNTMEHYNPRYTKKNLFYSCSLLVAPYVKHGENIKRTSVKLGYTGSALADNQVDLYDDKYGNLHDKTIESSSFVKKHKLIGYWGFNDEFRFFELNYGTLGGSYAQNKTHLPLRCENGYGDNNKNFRTFGYYTSHFPGVEVTGSDTSIAADYPGQSGDLTITSSGMCLEFHSGSKSYVQVRDINEKVNFRNDEEFAISFWCKLPKHQAISSSKVTENSIITKRGVERVPFRENRKFNRQVKFRDENLTRNRYPFDISVSNHEHPTQDAGQILFRRSDGSTITTCTSVTPITGSGWKHVVCQKSGSFLAVWIDGEEKNSVRDRFHGDDNTNIMNPSHLMFGALNRNANRQMSGSLDEVRIYNTYLTSAEIKSLANRNYHSGSLYQTTVVGNVFYRTGQIVVSSPMPKHWYALQYRWNLEYKSSRTIYENEVLVKVPANECNVSMNPTLRKPKSSIIQGQFTGSGFKPYITTVGLYDDNAQLLAVAKLARAVQKREDVDMNFLIKWDY